MSKSDTSCGGFSDSCLLFSLSQSRNANSAARYKNAAGRRRMEKAKLSAPFAPARSQATKPHRSQKEYPKTSMGYRQWAYLDKDMGMMPVAPIPRITMPKSVMFLMPVSIVPVMVVMVPMVIIVMVVVPIMVFVSLSGQ